MSRSVAQTRLKHHTPVSYQATVLADSPLAYWRCGESAGATTLADSSGNSETATINGTVTTGVTGAQRMGNAATFAAASGYLTVASSVNFRLTGNMTSECWWKIPVALISGSNQYLHCCGAVGETSGTNALYQHQIGYVDASNLSWSGFHESGSGTNSSVTVAFAASLMMVNQFNHLVFVRDVTANTYAFYLNGKIVGSPASYGANDPSGGGSAVYNYNRNPAAPDLATRVSTSDEIAIYNTALSAARIFEHYRAGRR